MTRTRAKLVLLVCSPAMASLVVASAVLAQALPPVDQIGLSNADAVEQVSDGASDIIAPTRSEPRQSIISDQRPDQERTPNAAQLTLETGLTRTTTQVSIGGRSSAGSAPLSRPSQGRGSAAVDRLAGDDRCDPSHREASTTKACASVIEKGSAEFAAREAAPLSPEQRILIEQQRRANGSDPRGAARRLANSGTDSDLPELQGIASLVLRAPPEPSRDAKPIEDRNGLDAAAAIVTDVLGQLNVPPAP